MTTGAGSIFSEFLEDYYAESEEHLATVRRNLLMLETASVDAEGARLIEELLRDFHSLKGLASMVGITEITRITHLSEEYLHDLQTVGLTLDSQGIDALMNGVKAMEQVIATHRKGMTLPDVSSILIALRPRTITSVADEPAEAAAAAITAKSADTATAAETFWHFSFQPSAELAEQ